jgi:hypothetical protein
MSIRSLLYYLLVPVTAGSAALFVVASSTLSPIPLIADDRPSGGDHAFAILSMHEAAPDSVRINGDTAYDHMAVFEHDQIETKRGVKSVAALRWGGGEILIQPETLMHIDQQEVVLDHGRVMVITNTGFRLRAGCAEVTPVDLAAQTSYDVTDVDGSVKVAAIQRDVRLAAKAANGKGLIQASGTPRSASKLTLVPSGSTASRPEKCGPAWENPAAAKEGILNSPYVKWGVIASGVGVACYALCGSNSPVSPAIP